MFASSTQRTNAVTSNYMQRHLATLNLCGPAILPYLLHSQHTSLLNLRILHSPIARFFGFPNVALHNSVSMTFLLIEIRNEALQFRERVSAQAAVHAGQ